MKKRDHFARYVFIGCIMVVFGVVFLIKLVNIEVTGQGYFADSSHVKYYTRTETIQALRGEIYDRNGKPLVTNEYYNEVYFDAGSLPSDNEKRNDAILRVLSNAEACGEKDSFRMPAIPFLKISNQSGTQTNIEYDSEYMSKVYGKRLKKTLLEIVGEDEDGEIPEASEAFELLRERYGLCGEEGEALYSAEDEEILFAVRCEMDMSYFSSEEPYTILRNVSLTLITKLKEDAIRGVMPRSVVNRVYNYPGIASHLLGRTGKIQAAKADYYKELGYPMNAVVGISGAEEAFEEYLRGVDGKKTIIEDEFGNVIDEYVSVEPVPGKNVWLTLDIDVQRDAETALKNNIELIVANAADRDPDESCVGEDASSGALTLVRVSTGEVIAAATYPSYDLSTFDEDYEKLRTDELSPLFNRALEGTYAPGSTFKPGVAAAALQENVVTPYTELPCTGTYTYYEDTQWTPHCWFRAGHGKVAVTEAIQVSCNCYFYEVGRQLTISKMNKYCKGYGLGQPTGIELNEKTGVLAGPEYREEHGMEPWTDGQTITAAIGQSDNLFTPLQISNYIATLINGGTRYKAHFLYQVRSFYTDEVVYEPKPEVMDDSVKLSDSIVTIVLNAMKDVVENGSAARVFTDYPVNVGGKTGTAQVKLDESDNAVFTAFAPFSDPEVVASCVIEHGASGTDAGYAVRDTFTSYFGLDLGDKEEKNEKD